MRQFLCVLLMATIIGTAWPVQAGDLDAVALAEFLPEPQAGWKLETNVAVLANIASGDDRGVTAVMRYIGNPGFEIILQVDEGAAAERQAIFDNTDIIELHGGKIVEIGGTEFMLIAGKVSAVLPGNVLINTYSSGDHVVQHLAAIDFEGLSAAAQESAAPAVNTRPAGAGPQQLVIALASQTVRLGRPVSINVKGLPGNRQDWLALVPANAPDSTFGQQWAYTQGARDGNWTFIAPRTGEYEVRVYFNWPDGAYKVQARTPVSVVAN